MKQKLLKSFSATMLAVACAFTMFAALPSLTAEAADATLLNTYGATYGKSGTCINLSQLRDSSQLAALKKDFNSITLENEMKPDSLLGSGRTISVAEAKRLGYYIPSNYTESTVPQINFSTVDQVMKICNENGLKMRAHTLVWHSQTPEWFFKTNYSNNNGYVSTQVMDARLEMYVKTVINHVYNDPNGKVVYAWDVANEIIHSNGQGWERVYGSNKTNATYVKKAFTFAYDALSEFGLQDSVKLFYNDYNEYEVADKICDLVKYINSEKEICGGIGMQSHVGLESGQGMYPDMNLYGSAIKKFSNLGLEVQITELDIKTPGNNASTRDSYAKQLFDTINKCKNDGANITGITWWGLSDQTTWIGGQSPLLFSSPGNPKPVYNTVINSYISVFGEPGAQVPTPTPTPVPTPTPTPVVTPTPTPVPTVTPTPTPTPVPTAEPTPVPTPIPTKGLTVSSTINNWGSGYQVSIRIDNKSGKTVDGWTVKIKKSDVNITNGWNFKSTVNGDYYELTPVEWNSKIYDGQSVEFGFIGSGNVADKIDVTVQ